MCFADMPKWLSVGCRRDSCLNIGHWVSHGSLMKATWLVNGVLEFLRLVKYQARYHYSNPTEGKSSNARVSLSKLW